MDLLLIRTSRIARVGVMCAGLVLCWSPPARAQDDKGRQAFAKAGCESCHGPGAKGADAPALAGLKRSYPEFVKIVREGVGEMPQHSKDEVSDAELDVIYKWLVQLSSKRSDRVTRPAR